MKNKEDLHPGASQATKPSNALRIGKRAKDIEVEKKKREGERTQIREGYSNRP